MTSKILPFRPFALGACLLLAALLFFTGLGSHDLWAPDEPRFAQAAREMMDSGDYLVPRVNGQPYREKPPLLLWAIAAVTLPIRHTSEWTGISPFNVMEWTARVPSALAGLWAVCCTFLLARRMYGERVAFWSGLVLATSLTFWWEARTVRTDMLLTGALAAVLLAFWRWHEERRVKWLLLLYGALAVAMYAKGPPALVFPLLAMFAFYWKKRDERRRMHWVAGFVGVIALTALWFIPARLGASTEAAGALREGIGGNLFRQTIGRFFLGVSKAQWPWYYLVNFPLDLFPWTVFLPWAIPWVWKRRREDERMRFLLSWLAPAFIFFSICIGKRAIYLLPVYPVIAILLARSVLDLMSGERAVWRRSTAIAWGALLTAVAAAALSAPWLAPQYPLPGTALALVGGAAGALAILTFAAVWRRRDAALHCHVAAHFSVVALLVALFVLPGMDSFKSARAICGPVWDLNWKGAEFRLYSVGFSREEFIFYSNHFHEPVFTDIIGMGYEDPVAEAQLQKRARQDLVKALEDIPIELFADLQPGEIQALEEGVRQVLEDTELGRDKAQAYLDMFQSEVEAFAARFMAPGQAFLFVQQEDWRWLVALHPPLAELRVVEDRMVGSREVLLIENQPRLRKG